MWFCFFEVLFLVKRGVVRYFFMNKIKIKISSLILLGAFSAGIVSGSAVSALEDIGNLSKHNKDTKNEDEVATVLKADSTGKEKEFVRKGTDFPNKANNFIFTGSEDKNTNESSVNTRVLVGTGAGTLSLVTLSFVGKKLVEKHWSKSSDAAVEYTIPDKGTDTPDANSDSSDLSENENKSKSWLSSVPVWLKVLLVITVLCFGTKKCVSFFSRKTNNTENGDYKDTGSELEENQQEKGSETSTFEVPSNVKNNSEINMLEKEENNNNNSVKEKLKEILLGLSNVNGENSDKNPGEYEQKIEKLFKSLHDSLFNKLESEELDECLNSLVNAFGDNKAILVNLILNDEFDADSLTGLIRMLPLVRNSEYANLYSGFVQLLNTFYKNNSKMGSGLIAALLRKVSSKNSVRKRFGLAKFFNLLLVRKDEDSDNVIKGLVSLLTCESVKIHLGEFAFGLANLLQSFNNYGVCGEKSKFEHLFNLLNFVFKSKDESVKDNLAALIKLLDGGSSDHGVLTPSVNFVNLINEEGVLEKFKEKLKDKDFKARDFVSDLDVEADSFDKKAFANKWGIGENMQSNVDDNNFIEN